MVRRYLTARGTENELLATVDGYIVRAVRGADGRGPRFTAGFVAAPGEESPGGGDWGSSRAIRSPSGCSSTGLPFSSTAPRITTKFGATAGPAGSRMQRGSAAESASSASS